jgi:multiple sugar transport system permease protein
MSDLAVDRAVSSGQPTSSILIRAGSGPESRSRHAHRRERRGLLFVAPFLVMFFFFLVIPICYALYDSFFTSRLVGGTVFSGFSNYETVLESGAFWSSMLRVLVYAAIQVPVMIVIAIFFATMFDIGVAKWGGLFRTVFFVPFAVPTVVAGVMWSFLLEDQYGPLARIFADLGLPPPHFLAGGAHLLGSIILIAIWEWTGYTMVILFTALKSVPRDVIESAVLDGANLRKVVLGIKVPMIRPAITLVSIINLNGSPYRLHDEHLLQLHAHRLPLQPGVRRPGVQRGGGDLLCPRVDHHPHLRGLRRPAAAKGSLAMSARAAAVSRRQRRSVREAQVIPLRLYGVKRWTVVVVTTLAILFAIFTLVPLWWIFVNSTKSEPNLFATFGFWFAHPFQLFHNMEQIFDNQSQGSLAQWVVNTIIYAFAGGTGATILSATAGYGFARFNFRGNHALFMIILSALLVPLAAVAIPLYILYARVHLDSTMAGIFLPYMVTPVGVYLMRVYVSASVPRELLDSARVDGAGEWRVFQRVALPLMVPALITVFLLSTVSSWNNFFLPFIVNNNASLDPLPVGVFVWFQHSVSGGGYQDFYLYTICAGFLTVVPIIILFLVLQRYWRGGLLVGSITG